MMKKGKRSLAEYSESQREKAHKKYRIIEPAINYEKSLLEIATQENISLRTLY
jgi:hypothetical protein